MKTPEDQSSEGPRDATANGHRWQPDRSAFGHDVDRLNAEADLSGFLNQSLVFWDTVQHSEQELPAVDSTNRDGNPSTGSAVGVATEPLRLGPYLIEEKIGEGGFSRIYAARHRLHPDLSVAVKVFRNLRLDTWQRLHLETLVLSRFNHPNLVAVLDAGETEDGTPYLVMNRIEGVSLEMYLRQHSLDYPQLAELFREIALAVQHAHDRDVVHRDLKPTNIMVRPNGQPVVIDFGLAKRLNLSGLDRSLTASNAVIGTLGYLAPEQADGKKHEVTRAVDVYGLGATLYFALTGRPPLERGDFWRAMEELKHKAPEKPSQINAAIPRDLELICLKCLEKVPGDRYPSLQQVADDLERFMAGRSVLARPASWLQRQVRWSQANPTVATLAGVLLVAVTGGLVATSTLWRQADFRWQESQQLLTQAQEILQTYDKAAETMLVQTPDALEYRYEHLTQSIKFREQLNAMMPENQVNRHSLAVAYFRLGKICCRRGLFEEGHENYRISLALIHELLATDPTNPKLRFDFFHQCLALDQTSGELGLSSGDDLSYLQQALEVVKLLVHEHPENIHYRDALACNLLILGGRVYETDPQQCREYLLQAYQEALSLKQKLPEPCLQWRHVGTSATSLADMCLEDGDLEEAETWSLIAIEAVESYMQRPDFDPPELMDLAGCQLLQRRIALYRGDEATAEAWAEQYRTLLKTSAKKYPDHYVFAESLANSEEVLVAQNATVK